MEHILDKLSTEQLEKLRKAIFEVLARRNGIPALPEPIPPAPKKASDFLGKTVQFKDRAGDIRKGRVYKVNAKTVGVIEISTGQKWRVSPSLLTLV